MFSDQHVAKWQPPAAARHMSALDCQTGGVAGQGQAYVSGRNHFFRDPQNPFAEGFIFR